MGFGAIMIPGGNAQLILQDIPQLSAHAIPAYLAYDSPNNADTAGVKALLRRVGNSQLFR